MGGLILGSPLLGGMTPFAAYAQQAAGFVAPPRSVSDITAVLDGQKPDAARLAKLQTTASAVPPASLDDTALAAFHYERAEALSDLGRAQEAVAAADLSIELGRKLSKNVFRQQQFAVSQYAINYLGDPKRSVELLLDMEKSLGAAGANAEPLLSVYRNLVMNLVVLGDFKTAEAYVDKSKALFEKSRHGPRAALTGSSLEADLELSVALLAEGQGRFADAETAYARSEIARRDSLEKSAKWPSAPPRANFLRVIDGTLVRSGRVKALQGRTAEAEVDVRRALLSQLNEGGKYHPATLNIVGQLANILVQQGRYAEAERLARTEVEAFRSIGFAENAQSFVFALNTLANALSLQARWTEAAAVYADIDKATASWPDERRDFLALTPASVSALYRTDRLQAGIERAQALVAYQRLRVGDGHIDHAIARGVLADGLARTGRIPAALAEFRTALPVLAALSRHNEDEDGATMAARHQQIRDIVEAYIALLAREPASPATAAESFSLADAVRGRSVGSAVAAASSRVAARDPVLAELTRREQDLRKQVGAKLATLNTVLTLPAADRDETAVTTLRAETARLGREREAATLEIAVRFPDYADLIDPKPATVVQVQGALRDGEAFLSFYFGQERSFVWAVPRTGAVQFAEIAATPQEIEARIRKLREALEPNAATISDIPVFDTNLAHELYGLLLKPVESVWRPARSLIVATNGALGLLPLGVLPTAPAVLGADSGAAFANYRAIPWLARSHAVTMMPSAGALRTLRQLPPGSPRRDALIGFGDPLFNPAQAAEAAPATAAPTAPPSSPSPGQPLERRSAPRTEELATARIGDLPRLPDTADELRSIAQALGSDPARTLKLGRDAEEEDVKSADLSNYRVVVFATHGLVPGDLDGLHQPALALSAPEVTGHAGDGLLTLDEILALKLDADWVVLSACNTGAGDGAGAEAASGLGRAFFYAGTRAVLLTNWSVHSQSARELVTDIFRRQAADQTLDRAEALRRAMVGVMDGPGHVDRGKTRFTYAHPLFWAPYSIVGDGG
ncbi:tetratricopeptide repeat protein [soil metagenome]